MRRGPLWDAVRGSASNAAAPRCLLHQGTGHFTLEYRISRRESLRRGQVGTPNAEGRLRGIFHEKLRQPPVFGAVPNPNHVQGEVDPGGHAAPARAVAVDDVAGLVGDPGELLEVMPRIPVTAER